MEPKAPRETATWLASLISTDGTVRQGRGRSGSPCLEIVLCSADPDWTYQICNILWQDLGLKTSVYWIASKTPKTGELTGKIVYYVRVRPLEKVFVVLRAVQAFMIPKKWKILEDYFNGTPDEQKRLEAYREANLLVSQGVAPYRVSLTISEKYEVNDSTVRHWLYKGTKPPLANRHERVKVSGA